MCPGAAGVISLARALVSVSGPDRVGPPLAAARSGANAGVRASVARTPPQESELSIEVPSKGDDEEAKEGEEAPAAAKTEVPAAAAGPPGPRPPPPLSRVGRAAVVASLATVGVTAFATRWPALVAVLVSLATVPAVAELTCPRACELAPAVVVVMPVVVTATVLAPSATVVRAACVTLAAVDVAACVNDPTALPAVPGEAGAGDGSLDGTGTVAADVASATAWVTGVAVPATR